VITAVDKLTLNLTTKIIFTREMLGYLYECDLSVVFHSLSTAGLERWPCGSFTVCGS